MAKAEEVIIIIASKSHSRVVGIVCDCVFASK